MIILKSLMWDFNTMVDVNNLLKKWQKVTLEWELSKYDPEIVQNSNAAKELHFEEANIIKRVYKQYRERCS